MLLADKRDLQNSLKVSLLQIEEKELNYYTTNCMTVGTQAAMLAGFAFQALIEVDVVDPYMGGDAGNEWRRAIVRKLFPDGRFQACMVASRRSGSPALSTPPTSRAIPSQRPGPRRQSGGRLETVP